MVVAKPMTIGQLSRRTGVPIKTLREYEQLGLIYTLGRSESNYRLFGEEALWCVQVIRTMRSLGLTLKEIQDIAALYLERGLQFLAEMRSNRRETGGRAHSHRSPH